MPALAGRAVNQQNRSQGSLVQVMLVLTLLHAYSSPTIAADAPPATQEATHAANGGAIIHVGGRDLQQIIDQAPPHSIILCDPNRQITLSTPVKIHKPLTLRGLNARLPEKLGLTSLVMVTAEGATEAGIIVEAGGKKKGTLSDYVITGNVSRVDDRIHGPRAIIANNLP